MRSKPSISITCSVCGQPFLAWPYEIRQGRRYCGSACRTTGVTGERIPLAARLWGKVQRGSTEECWPFTGARNQYGYGVLSRGSPPQGTTLAHRIAYELTYGPILNGLVLMHECDNPPCCNPLHLTPGTYSQNNRDARARLPRKPGGTRGSRNTLAKLTEDDVLLIRTEWDGTYEHRLELAQRFNVSTDNIRLIVQRKTWRHV